MTPGPYAWFIVAAYAAAALVVVGLILWVSVDYRSQRRLLSQLDAKRSLSTPAQQAETETRR